MHEVVLPRLISTHDLSVTPDAPFASHREAQFDLAGSVRARAAEGVCFRVSVLNAANLQDFMGKDNFALVSDRFREAVEKHQPADVEFFPAKIELAKSASSLVGGGGDVVENGYWLFNSWRRVDVVDRERSESPIHENHPCPGEFVVEATGGRVVLRDHPLNETLFGIKGVLNCRFLSSALAESLRSLNGTGYWVGGMHFWLA